MELETERLILREYRESDFETTHAYGSDPEVTRYTIFGPNTEAETRGFLAKMQEVQRQEPRNGFELAIVLKATGKHFGGIGLRIGKGATGELGYVIHKDYWGKGYVPEAARALMDYGFKTLKLHRIFAKCHTDNAASFRVMEKLGMRREGHMLKDLKFKGSWRDSYLYAILAEEWH